MSKQRRKTFAAREDLLNQLGRIAERKGLSLYSLINEIFELAVKADEVGVELKRLIEGRGVLERARRSSFILVPEPLWYEMADQTYRKGKRESLKNWFATGEWIAKRYISSGVENPFKLFKNSIEDFTWNVSEFKIDRDDKTGWVTARLISPKFSESHAKLFASLLEGALKAFGYKIVEEDVSAGAIRIKAKREG